MNDQNTLNADIADDDEEANSPSSGKEDSSSDRMVTSDSKEFPIEQGMEEANSDFSADDEVQFEYELLVPDEEDAPLDDDGVDFSSSNIEFETSFPDTTEGEIETKQNLSIEEDEFVKRAVMSVWLSKQRTELDAMIASEERRGQESGYDDKIPAVCDTDSFTPYTSNQIDFIRSSMSKLESKIGKPSWLPMPEVRRKKAKRAEDKDKEVVPTTSTSTKTTTTTTTSPSSISDDIPEAVEDSIDIDDRIDENGGCDEMHSSDDEDDEDGGGGGGEMHEEDFEWTKPLVEHFREQSKIDKDNGDQENS